MSNDSASDSDVSDEDDARATWMDIYVLYSAVVGLVAFCTGIVDANGWVSVWGLWTCCSIPYFAKDRLLWSWKCDVVMIATAFPVVFAETNRNVMRLVAWIQIAVHLLLLAEWQFRRRVRQTATVRESSGSEENGDCTEM